jgi:hypothetical protein
MTITTERKKIKQIISNTDRKVEQMKREKKNSNKRKKRKYSQFSFLFRKKNSINYLFHTALLFARRNMTEQ